MFQTLKHYKFEHRCPAPQHSKTTKILQTTKNPFPSLSVECSSVVDCSSSQKKKKLGVLLSHCFVQYYLLLADCSKILRSVVSALVQCPANCFQYFVKVRTWHTISSVLVFPIYFVVDSSVIHFSYIPESFSYVTNK